MYVILKNQKWEAIKYVIFIYELWGRVFLFMSTPELTSEQPVLTKAQLNLFPVF